MFLDEATIYIQSGAGGDGCESFFKRSDRKMVPNGGDGGKGGSIIFEADNNMGDLLHYKYNKHFSAASGGRGTRNQKTGRNGGDLILRVPVGTTIINADDHLTIRDLVSPGDRVVCLEGSDGGRGNQHGRSATKGAPPKSMHVKFSLKLVADIFLVGEANAGKSSLLRFLTRAKVGDSSYPFSTLAPQMGVFETPQFRSVTICDLPSVMEGSSRGKGLGVGFLKHLARARLVFLMLDPYRDFSVDLERGYNILLNEVSSAFSGFSKLPHFVVVSKLDQPEIRDRLGNRKFDFKTPQFLISTKTGEGVKPLMDEAERLLFPNA